jgi:hypothetical protein
MRYRAGAPASTVLALLLIGAAPPGGPMKIEVEVPPGVAADAAARAGGNAAAPSPVLMLEGLELGYGEGLTLRVLAPPAAAGGVPEILAVSGLVGEPQRSPAAPLQHLTLAVPLNLKASRLLAGKRKIVLILEIEDDPGRPPLKFKRAYFDTGEKRPAAPPR